MSPRSRTAAAVAPELVVQLTKRADGGVVLRCVRRDGTATWQRQVGGHAMWFPFHDLRHFAVETTLGFTQGFYGLVADGWDIDDTGGKGARGPIPPEAGVVEHLVGLLDRERMGGAPPLSAEYVNAHLTNVGQIGVRGRTMTVRPLTDAELDAVRAEADRLHEAWAVLPEGETLELVYDRSTLAP
jgi:hypothetical protein